MPPSDSKVPPAVPARLAAHHCGAWLDWAAADIDACLTENDAWTGEVLGALGARMDALPAEAVVVAVQSHDRVTQRLTHLAEALRALRAQLMDAGSCTSGDSWERLRDRQLSSFSMADERILFRRLVPAADEPGDHDDPSDAADGIEMFDLEGGATRPAT